MVGHKDNPPHLLQQGGICRIKDGQETRITLHGHYDDLNNQGNQDGDIEDDIQQRGQTAERAICSGRLKESCVWESPKHSWLQNGI